MRSAQPTTGAHWIPVAILAIGAFTTTVNTTLLSPLLTPIAADFAVSDSVTGQIGTVTATSAAIAALVIAPWLDRASRRTWLRLECIVLGAGTLLSALAPSFGWLVVGRALGGLGGGFIFAVCLAAVGDLFAEPARRNRAIGLVGSGATLGVVVGLPVLTQVSAAIGWRWAIGLLLPQVVLLYLGAGRLPPRDPGARGSLWRGWAAGYRTVLGHGETLALLGLLVALCMVWFGWLIYFGAFAASVFGIGAGVLSALFLVGGSAEVVANNLTPVLLRIRSPSTIVLGAGAVISINLLGVGLISARTSALFVFMAITSLASVVLFTSLSILLLDSLPTARGAVMSLQSAGFEVGSALGAAAAGATLSVGGDYGTVYRLLGCVLAVTVVLWLTVGRRLTHLVRPVSPCASFGHWRRRRAGPKTPR